MLMPPRWRPASTRCHQASQAATAELSGRRVVTDGAAARVTGARRAFSAVPG